jgi:AcrR family transcriptional regulator
MIIYNKHSISKMPKIVDRQQYRKQLLQQSFELFAEIGYGNITMRQLAQKLGVSTGTLYHYFPSKEAMFLQLVTEQTQQDIATFLSRASAIPPDIRSRVRAILDFVSENREYFTQQTIVSLDYCQQHRNRSQEPQADPIFAQVDRELIQVINDYLPIDNPEIAGFILNFINGLILGEIYHSNFTNWEVQSELFVEAIAGISNK